jgi:hypothetical protein
MFPECSMQVPVWNFMEYSFLATFLAAAASTDKVYLNLFPLNVS